jgi:hypothetical protein
VEQRRVEVHADVDRCRRSENGRAMRVMASGLWFAPRPLKPPLGANSKIEWTRVRRDQAGQTMVKLTDDERRLLEHIADEPLAPISPLQTIVEELIGLQLVTVDPEGRWIVTEAGAKALRHDRPLQ